MGQQSFDVYFTNIFDENLVFFLNGSVKKFIL